MAKIKIVILGISIAVVLAFLIGFGIETFYKSPKYEDFCGDRDEPFFYDTKDECEANGGRWNDQEIKKPVPLDTNQYLCTKGAEQPDGRFYFNCETRESLERDEGFCQLNYYCSEEFDEARKPYNRNVFIITVILGIISILTGTYLKLTSVSAGIMGGGILTIIYGSIRYWRDMNDYLRFIILVIAFGVLVWLGYKKFKK